MSRLNIANLKPPPPAAPITGRNPAVESLIRVLINLAASDTIELGIITHSDVAERLGFYFMNMVNDPVEWEKILNAVEGPVGP